MAEKYLAADSALNAATASIFALRATITQKDVVINLRGHEIATLNILVDNLRNQDLTKQELFTLEKIALKQKIKRKNRIILGEGGVIAILLLALLL